MKKQYGFSAVHTVLIIILIVIVCSTGWYVWHSKQSAERNFEQAENTSKATKTNKPKIERSTSIVQSNEIPDSDVQSNTSISLSGKLKYADANLSWSVDDLVVTNGFYVFGFHKEFHSTLSGRYAG